ncbi:tRNA-specific adenosine deaminase [bacterium HR36]|nr:tRNA-specific adenosine deaminase [bacterium HR36]
MPPNGESDLMQLSQAGHPLHGMFMELALEEAELAWQENEVPVGAVIVSWDQGVIARAHNQREQLQDPTAHAEMLAITQAAAALGSWRLERCTLYVTLEPCPMCAGAIVQARLPLVVFGALDPKAGACRSLYRIPEDPRLNHRAVVVGGIMAQRCGELLRDFFRLRRQTHGESAPEELS